MTERSASVADDPIAGEAAEDVLLSGGSALGAVVAGFLAAAGAHSGVLLSPVSVLAAGAGLGARAFDGRCRQPGLGTKRPRGFRESDVVPQAAKIAVPAALTAVLVALAYDEQAKVGRVVKSALRRARDSGALARAEFFERVRAVGAGAVTEASFVRPLLHAAGAGAGGVLTPTDLRSIGDIDQPAVVREAAGARWVTPPWAWDAGLPPTGDELGRGHAICAIDARGFSAALSYRRVMNGVTLEDLELEAPPIAVPVLRGITRVAPGAPIPTPAPIAVRVDEGGAPLEVVAAPAAAELDADVLGAAKLRVRWDPAVRRATVVRL